MISYLTSADMSIIAFIGVILHSHSHVLLLQN